MYTGRLAFLAVTACTILLLAACETTPDDGVVDAADDAGAELADEVAVDDAADDSIAESADETTGDEITDEEFDEALEQAIKNLGFDTRDDVVIPELDLETLSAETPERTFEAEAFDNVFVGKVTEELFIGISLDSQYVDQAGEIVAYVCDSQDTAVSLSGMLGDDDTARLSDDESEIELTVSGEEITGTVTINEYESESFTATPATGDAGMYYATKTVDGQDISGQWIALENGEQRGSLTYCYCRLVRGVEVCVCVQLL